MQFSLFRAPIVPANAAGLSTEELRRYLGVGRNMVTSVARRFGIEKLHGIYSERVVWRQLFGLAPDTDAAEAALREPLADINWVSNATGVPQSTIRDHLASGAWKYDRGTQLGAEDATHPPRLRRWIPALIRSRVCGSPLPQFSCIAPLAVSADSTEMNFPRPATSSAPQAEQPEDGPHDDLFLALLADAQTASRQR